MAPYFLAYLHSYFKDSFLTRKDFPTWSIWPTHYICI